MSNVLALSPAAGTGLGPLEPLLADPAVTDIVVNGAAHVWVDRGQGLEPGGVRFADDAAVRHLAQRLVLSAGRRLDDAAPFADARLPGGIRLHAVLAPIARGGTLLSLRIPSRRVLPLADYVRRGSMPSAAVDVLCALVSARLPLLVTGGTGTGKTTLLASLLSQVEPAERIIVIEEFGELRPDHPHVVSLEARPANVEGAGCVGLATLVRESLRMRPDRIVVGEVRGAEVLDLLTALTSGHDGGAATLHAPSVGDVPARLEALALCAGVSRAAVHSLLAAVAPVIVHVQRGADGIRRLATVGILQRGDDGTVEATEALTMCAGEIRAGAAADVLRVRLAERGVSMAPVLP